MNIKDILIITVIAIIVSNDDKAKQALENKHLQEWFIVRTMEVMNGKFDYEDVSIVVHWLFEKIKENLDNNGIRLI